MGGELCCEIETFDDWSELRKRFDQFNSDWVFRGQRCAEWPLLSSLERVAHYYDPKDRVNVERFFLFQFKRRVHNYLNSSLLPKDESDILEWLGLMQHHGAPTRLLDFTKSPYVATFFAVEDAREECAVWAIDKDWCLYQAASKIANKIGPIDFTSLRWALANPQAVVRLFEHVFFRPPLISCTLAVEPYRMNERLTVQQGCFVCPGDVGRAFQENLVDSSDPVEVRKNVIKLVISPEIRKEALYDLYTMNINRASLFPGMDGFAQSLKHQLMSYDLDHLTRMFAETFIDEMIGETRKKLGEADKD